MCQPQHHIFFFLFFLPLLATPVNSGWVSHGTAGWVSHGTNTRGTTAFQNHHYPSESSRSHKSSQSSLKALKDPTPFTSETVDDDDNNNNGDSSDKSDPTPPLRPPTLDVLYQQVGEQLGSKVKIILRKNKTPVPPQIRPSLEVVEWQKAQLQINDDDDDDDNDFDSSNWMTSWMEQQHQPNWANFPKFEWKNSNSNNKNVDASQLQQKQTEDLSYGLDFVAFEEELNEYSYEEEEEEKEAPQKKQRYIPQPPNMKNYVNLNAVLASLQEKLQEEKLKTNFLNPALYFDGSIFKPKTRTAELHEEKEEATQRKSIEDAVSKSWRTDSTDAEIALTKENQASLSVQEEVDRIMEKILRSSSSSSVEDDEALDKSEILRSSSSSVEYEAEDEEPFLKSPSLSSVGDEVDDMSKEQLEVSSYQDEMQPHRDTKEKPQIENVDSKPIQIIDDSGIDDSKGATQEPETNIPGKPFFDKIQKEDIPVSKPIQNLDDLVSERKVVNEPVPSTPKETFSLNSSWFDKKYYDDVWSKVKKSVANLFEPEEETTHIEKSSEPTFHFLTFQEPEPQPVQKPKEEAKPDKPAFKLFGENGLDVSSKAEAVMSRLFSERKEETLFSLEAKTGVPEHIVRGAALSTVLFCLATHQNLETAAVAVPAFCYLSQTRGMTGDKLRAIGQFTHDSTVAVSNIVQKKVLSPELKTTISKFSAAFVASSSAFLQEALKALEASARSEKKTDPPITQTAVQKERKQNDEMLNPIISSQSATEPLEHEVQKALKENQSTKAEETVSGALNARDQAQMKLLSNRLEMMAKEIELKQALKKDVKTSRKELKARDQAQMNLFSYRLQMMAKEIQLKQAAQKHLETSMKEIAIAKEATQKQMNLLKYRLDLERSTASSMQTKGKSETPEVAHLVQPEVNQVENPLGQHSTQNLHSQMVTKTKDSTPISDDSLLLQMKLLKYRLELDETSRKQSEMKSEVENAVALNLNDSTQSGIVGRNNNHSAIPLETPATATITEETPVAEPKTKTSPKLDKLAASLEKKVSRALKEETKKMKKIENSLIEKGKKKQIEEKKKVEEQERLVEEVRSVLNEVKKDPSKKEGRRKTSKQKKGKGREITEKKGKRREKTELPKQKTKPKQQKTKPKEAKTSKSKQQKTTSAVTQKIN